MFKLLQYLKFLLNSTNQHGVHSPFIYSYVTKCLYARPDYPYSKSLNVLLKSITYFDAKQVWFLENRQLEKKVQNHFPNMRFSEKKGSKILFLSTSDKKELEIVLSNESSIQNDSLLLIDNIYGSREKNKVWRKIKLHKKVSVTLDMFYCGAVFFRKEQAKEHFKIRI